MNKSKFKSVKFLPFDAEMYYSSQEMWINSFCFGSDSSCVLKVTDTCIENNPELFEVEEAEREFEEGEYYWAKVWEWSDWDAVKYSHGVFYFVGVSTGFTPNRLYLIAEKIGK